MAEKKHPGPGMPPPGPHGPGHAPKGGFRKPKNMRGTLRKLMRYLGRYKAHLALVVILLFILLIVRGYYIAMHARDRFGALLAAGISTHFALQTFLNIGVVTNFLPATGISLPFFSYGGTALLMQLFEAGIVLAVSRQNDNKLL